MRIVNNQKKVVKLQSRISVITRERLVKSSKHLGISGTQAISDLIEKEYQKLTQKED